MKKTVALAAGVILGLLGCAPNGPAPPGVRSLRQQRRQAAITLPAWDLDVAEEMAAHAAEYAGKVLVVERAYLDPRRPPAFGKDVSTFYLSGGGVVVVPTSSVPAWLRPWTGAPLKLRAIAHPQRQGDDGQALPGLILRGLALDTAHPLELAFVAIERAQDGTWLTAHIENYRGEPAKATLEVRFGTLHEKTRLPAIAPGEAKSVRVKLCSGVSAPRWQDFARSARSLRLLFEDGSRLDVDLGKWLEGPAALVLDWGYDFKPPATAVLALPADRPEAELERFAALELRSYLRLFCDANIQPREPESEEPLPALPLLVVGTAQANPLAAALIREAGLEERLRSVGADGYVLKSLRHKGQPAVLVAASTARGVAHGVYGLLHHYGVLFTLGPERLPAGVGLRAPGAGDWPTGPGQEAPPMPDTARAPARLPFRIVDVDEARAPAFARRQLVASASRTARAVRWSQHDWISMFALAAKNRFSEVVFPLDGLEATFTYTPGKSRDALFPFEFEGMPYSCVAEAYLGHQRGLAILADLARRRGLDLTFARTTPEGKLAVAAPPACLSSAKPPSDLGQAIPVLDDLADALGLVRIEEAAQKAAELLRAKSPVLAVPYRRGAGARVGFLAQWAWEPTLTPKAFAQSWAATLCEGKAAERLADAALALDRLDGDILGAAPRPFGQGTPLILPVEAEDLTCDWAKLKARATSEAGAAQTQALKAQGQKLRELQRQLEPIQTAFREALGITGPLWEEPLTDDLPAATRSERIAQRLYMLRTLLGAVATAQEATLAYDAGLATPEEALPQFRIACGRYRKARRLLLWVARGTRGTDLTPLLESTAEGLRVQADRLAELLGPALDVEPAARFQVGGSDAILYLFRAPHEDIYAAYKLAGREVIPLRFSTPEARLVRPGQPPRTIRAEGGAFLVPLDTVPTYIIARRAAWPGQPPE